MAVSVVVFDVGETLVDEAAAHERRQVESAVEPAFSEPDLHHDALPCLAALRAHGLRLGAAGNMHAVHEDFLVRSRRGAHTAVQSPPDTVTIASLEELPGALAGV